MFKLPSEPLIDLNERKSAIQNVLFIVAGIEGHCDAFKSLAEALETKNTLVIGLQYTSDVPYTSISESAKFYLTEIREKIKELGVNSFQLAGYSYGGLIAIEITRQLSQNIKGEPWVRSLILFESSHVFFKVGVHANAKKFGLRIPNRDIFGRTSIFTGPLSIYLSHMIGQPQLKYDIYKHLNSIKISGLDNAIDEAFQYLIDKGLLVFESPGEATEMKVFLRLFLLKSNAAVIYEPEGKLFGTEVVLMKSKKFIYNDLKDLFVRADYESDKMCPLELNEFDYNLGEICDRLKVVEFDQGNHWSFIAENTSEICSILTKLFNKKSKL